MRSPFDFLTSESCIPEGLGRFLMFFLPRGATILEELFSDDALPPFSSFSLENCNREGLLRFSYPGKRPKGRAAAMFC